MIGVRMRGLSSEMGNKRPNHNLELEMLLQTALTSL